MVKSLLRPLTVPKVTVTGLQDVQQQQQQTFSGQSPATSNGKKQKNKKR
jgi:hypothetical protein